MWFVGFRNDRRANSEGKGRIWTPQLPRFEMSPQPPDVLPVDYTPHLPPYQFYSGRQGNLRQTTKIARVDNLGNLILVATVTNTPKMVRDVAITRTVAETSAVSIPKAVARLLAVLETTSPVMVRAVTKLLPVTETTAPSMARAITKLLTVVETASPKTQRAVARLLSVVETTNPSTIRAITKIVSTLETTAPLMKRDITKFLKTLETTAPTLNGSKSFLVTLLAVVNSITSITTSTKKGTKIVPVIHRGGGTTRDGAQPVDRESERQANDAKAERNRKAIMRAHDLEVQIGQALLRGDVNLALVLMAERNDILEAIGYFK